MGTAEFSWGKAFGYALRYILYAILWIIIGGLIMGAGIGMMMASMRPGPWGIPTYEPGASIVGVVFIIIGLIIIYLGTMAAYFKIMSRLVYEATYKPPSS